MYGWVIPPPKEPTKTRQKLKAERIAKVNYLIKEGMLKSERIIQALLRVSREDFIPRQYRDYAYLEVPLPLPGEGATISCPHSYPLFYEPLGLDKGHKFLEIGTGSGYGAAVAREVVGPDGLVVSIEIDPITFAFAQDNLQRAGYRDVVLTNNDGSLGYPELQPFDRISITAACPEVPPPLIEQLATGGKLISPVIENDVQNLVLSEKTTSGMKQRIICEVLYIPLRGIYGAKAKG